MDVRETLALPNVLPEPNKNRQVFGLRLADLLFLACHHWSLNSRLFVFHLCIGMGRSEDCSGIVGIREQGDRVKEEEIGQDRSQDLCVSLLDRVNLRKEAGTLFKAFLN